MTTSAQGVGTFLGQRHGDTLSEGKRRRDEVYVGCVKKKEGRGAGNMGAEGTQTAYFVLEKTQGS